MSTLVAVLVVEEAEIVEAAVAVISVEQWWIIVGLRLLGGECVRLAITSADDG